MAAEYEYRGFKYRYIKSTGMISLYFDGRLVERGFETKRQLTEMVDYLVDYMDKEEKQVSPQSSTLR